MPCPGDDVFAIGIFGQSNATNTVYPPASIAFPENLLQFDWRSQKCYAYQEPLLGADHVVLATPVFFMGVPSQGKRVIDR